MEGVQLRFLRIVGTRLGFPYRGVPIDDLRQQLRLCDLSSRRQIADLVFLRKILTAEIDSPELLSRINFRCSRPSRSLDLFERSHHSTAYAYSSTLPRLHRLGNGLPQNIDFFSMSLTTFKQKLYECFL